MHEFKHLPLFCRFLLENRVNALVKEQLKVAIELDLPMLQHLKHFTEEQLISFSTISVTEHLQYLSENKGAQYTELSLKRWEADQLGILGKFEVVAEDITLINFLRGRVFRKFIPFYSYETDTVLELVDEIDSFLTGSTTAASNLYIRILKEQIEKNEKELLEAQRIALIGSYEWDLISNTSKNSPGISHIYDLEPGTKPEKFMEFIHKDDRGKIEEGIQNALKNGSYEYEYRFVKDGKTKYIHSKGIVIYDGEKPVKIIGVAQDISSQKLTEQELREKTIALERSNESLQQFAQVASHDLKEPVRKISLLTDQVIRREKNVSDASLTTLKKVHHSSTRMLQMIDDIMDYSAITQWEEKKTVELKDLVKEVIDFLEQAIEDKKAVILFNDLPVANVIPSQLRQLFQNLIANALKFSKPGIAPEITITHQWLKREDIQAEHLIVADKYLQISVHDNGIGFNQEFSKQIFQLFKRLHNKSDYEGSGIGLALAKRIIDNHGGTIHATSVEGEGAAFTFTIPG